MKVNEPITTKEYCIVPSHDAFLSIMESYTADLITSEKQKRLGVHKAENDYRALHYVGAVWLVNINDSEQKVPLLVHPKVSDDNRMLDAVSMLDIAIQRPEIFEACEKASQEDIFRIFDDQESIDSVDSVADISMFQAAWYLKMLASFCHRNLRQGFIRVDENLTGKVKGKILIEQQLRNNIVRGRADRICCRYETMTIDTLPNRILRYALRLATGLLNQKHSGQNNSLENIWLWARQAESALSGVALMPVAINDFRDIRYSGSLSNYKSIHALAKALIGNFRLDTSSGKIEPTGSIVPFALNMNTLYEAYVGVKLKNAGFENLLSQESMNVPFGKGYNKPFRPDYCSSCGRLVLDAKYKRYLQSSNDERISEDLEQLLAYSVLVPVAMKNKANIHSMVTQNEHWAFLVVPTMDQKEITLGNDRFPETVGKCIEMTFPVAGRLRAGVIECPVPTIQRGTKGDILLAD